MKSAALLLIFLSACTPAPQGSCVCPTPSPSPSVSVTPSPSATPSTSPSATPTSTASKYASCSKAITQPDSWVRQSIEAQGTSGFALLGCPTTPEVQPFADDGRYNYQAFEKGGLCIAWDWSRPKNYVFQNYIIQPCQGVPNYPGVSVTKPKFPIGVWFQPASSFAKWKGRGVNTMLGFETEGGTTPFAAWSRELQLNDLFTIRQPQGDLAADSADPRLLAWFVINDEPDLNPTADGKKPSDAQATHDRLKAAAPNVPLYINFSGGNIRAAARGGAKNTPDQYRAYMAAADWVSNDLYPITGWNRPDWIDQAAPIAYAPEAPTKYSIGWTEDTLASWAPGKLQMAILECNDQKLPWVVGHRAPTPDEFRGEIWESIIHGAKAVGYFPDCIGSGWCGFDTVPDAIVSEMTKQNGLITVNADWLSKPSTLVSVPVPFERATFGAHTVTVNMSHAPSTFEGVSYLPYEVKFQ